MEQLDVAIAFVEGRNVFFAILPTGFGKSLCYACLPASFDRIVRARSGLFYSCSGESGDSSFGTVAVNHIIIT